MEKIKRLLTRISAGLMTLMAYLFFMNPVFSQRPTHVPPDSPPVSFFDSITNIIVYIGIPLLIVILYVVWRSNLRKENKRKEERLKRSAHREEGR